MLSFKKGKKRICSRTASLVLLIFFFKEIDAFATAGLSQSRSKNGMKFHCSF